MRPLSFFLAFTLLAQQQPEGVATFTTSTQLVVEMVTVKDKNGRIVEGLTAKDFTLTEDGKPQTISFCEFQKLEEITPRPIEPVAGPAAQPPNRFQIMPEKPGDIRYRDRRLLALYFDMSAMPVPDQLRALSSALHFIKAKITPADLVAVLVYQDGLVKVLQDFTADRNLLNETLQKMILAEQGFDESSGDDSAADTGAAFGQDSGEFNIFNTDRQLAALQTAAKMLGSLNERKSLIYFASGLRLNGTNNQAQMQATINAAVRANVTFFPVDARGLVAMPPLGDATQGSAGGLAMYSGRSAMAMADSFQRSQDTLWALASDTGGKALLDNNDLEMGIVNAQQAISSYYILGYYTTNQTLDGKFRKIKITVNRPDLSVSLSYRQGYYSGKEFTKFTSADKERQLEDALMLGDPITELTIAMEVNFFQLNRAEYFVPVAVKIPGSELALAKKGGAERTIIDFIGEIKDEYGVTVTNVRDKADIRLTGESAADLAKHHIQYDTGFTLLPGTYSVKFLARDAETGRIGTYLTKFVIPNLNKEEKHVPISSVVLSSQRVEMREAVYTAGKASAQAAAQAVNPLVQDGQKLIPSVTRVFSRAKDLYVYLQAYERNAVTAQPVAAYVTFYRGKNKAFESVPVTVTEGLDPKSKALPIRFSLALAQLPPGKYTCQVTVVDPALQKAAYWSAPVFLVD